MPESASASSLNAFLRREQVRAVGTTFLRLRPAVVLCGAVANGGLLFASGAPAAQRALVGGGMAALLAMFAAEAWLLRRRQVSEAWLTATLAITAGGITMGCSFSGGWQSPLVPILFAPIGVGFAAFGRGRGASLWLFFSLAVLAALLALHGRFRFPPIAPPYAAAMAVVSSAITVILLRIGVAGLTDAYGRTAETLERMRVGVLEEARVRARDTEVVGARVAHDLKNPLAAIKGLLQLLSRSEKDAQAEKRFAVALGEIERMQSILDDYLTLARPLRDVSFEKVRLDEVVRHVAELIEATAERQGVLVTLDLNAVIAWLDKSRVADAVLNLVSNALAAMPAGGKLTLRVRRDETHATVEVADDGEGMDEAAVSAATDQFATGREGGSGLGLALVRGVARQHGGELRLVSARARGTTATLSLATAAEAPR